MRLLKSDLAKPLIAEHHGDGRRIDEAPCTSTNRPVSHEGLAHCGAVGDRAISCVYTFADGTVSVFDQHGRQMPEYRGRAAELMERIRAHAPASAFFQTW